MKERRGCLNCGLPAIKPKFCSKKCYGEYKSKNNVSIKKETLDKLYNIEKKNAAEIARILKFSISTVLRYLKRYGMYNGHFRYHIDYCGQKIGKMTMLEPIFPERRKGGGKHVIWKCLCDCGQEFRMQSHCLLNCINQCCNACSAIAGGIKRTKYRLMDVILRDVKKRAEEKKMEYNIDSEYMNNLLLEQNNKCCLTGVDISIALTSKKHHIGRETTASIDRIDSLKGYTKDNVQWVHKHINAMKLSTTQKDFIGWCKLVAEKFSDTQP